VSNVAASSANWSTGSACRPASDIADQAGDHGHCESANLIRAQKRPRTGHDACMQSVTASNKAQGSRLANRNVRTKDEQREDSAILEEASLF
jgi:hypothetical protein